MSKRKHKKNPMPLENEKICHYCEHCIYICEGDYICAKHQCIVIGEWEPTEEFCHCEGKDFVKI